jgi:hypothetical protein
MKLTRRTLNEALEREAARPTPDPSRDFVDALERRILGDGALVEMGDAGPIRRGRRAGVAVAVAVASLAAASVAAALPAIRNEHTRIVTGSSDSSIATTSTTSVASLTPVTSVPLPTEQASLTEPSRPESTPVAIDGTTSTSSTSVMPSTIAGTLPSVVTVTSTPAPSTTVVPTTSLTEPRTTPASSTTAAPVSTTTTTTNTSTSTSTTEATVPASLVVQCAAVSASSIRCTWSTSSDSRVAGYRLLRGVPSGPGRVFSTGPGDSSYTDTLPVSGVKYSFVVHAVDANGTSLGHSQLVYVTCCTP